MGAGKFETPTDGCWWILGQARDVKQALPGRQPSWLIVFVCLFLVRICISIFNIELQGTYEGHVGKARRSRKEGEEHFTKVPLSGSVAEWA